MFFPTEDMGLSIRPPKCYIGYTSSIEGVHLYATFRVRNCNSPARMADRSRPDGVPRHGRSRRDLAVRKGAGGGGLPGAVPESVLAGRHGQADGREQSGPAVLQAGDDAVLRIGLRRGDAQLQ